MSAAVRAVAGLALALAACVRGAAPAAAPAEDPPAEVTAPEFDWPDAAPTTPAPRVIAPAPR